MLYGNLKNIKSNFQKNIVRYFKHLYVNVTYGRKSNMIDVLNTIDESVG